MLMPPPPWAEITALVVSTRPWASLLLIVPPPSARTAPLLAMRSPLIVTLPLPPGAPEASRLPLLSTRPELSSTILPPRSLKPVATTLPVLRTTPPCNSLAAWADMMIMPPGACTAEPFSTSAAIAEGDTSTPARVRLSLNCREICSPAAIATVPAWAITMPLLRTCGASRAI